MPKQFLCKIKSKCQMGGPSLERGLRLASESCVVGAGISLLLSVAVWAGGKNGGERAHSERLGIFVGLWVPSLLIMASYLTRKADNESISDDSSGEIPFFEELM